MGLVALLVALVATTGVATAARDATQGVRAVGGPSVRLLHVTPVVRRAGQPVVVTLTRSGPATAPDATVQLTLYSRLTTRSGLLAAISAPGPSGPVSTTGPLDASCLTGGTSLVVPVAVAPDGVRVAPRALCGRAAPVLRLGADAGEGVYPLRVTVRGAGLTATLDTLVTYATMTSDDPLLVSWIVRVAGGQGGVTSAAPALEGVAAHPSVPLTVDVQGATLATAPVTGSSAVALLRTVVARPADELVNEAYVPAELGTLRASDLPDEVIRQFELNEVLLKTLGIETLPSPKVTIGTGPQTPTSADALASLGFRHVVVPSTSLATDPASTLTWGGAFRLGGAPSGPTALASDTELSTLSDQTASDPGLVGANLLGELAFLHFEQPDLADPRACVFVTDAAPSVTTAFVDTVLSGLTANPVVTPVTVSGAFARVPLGANGFGGVRDLALGPSEPFATSVIDNYRHLRITTDALSSAVRGGADPIPAIEGELLTSEQVLEPALRLAVMARVQDELQDQLGYFRIYDGPITLTQSGAELPFTIYSTAPYTFAGFLAVSSPKLTFPQGQVWKLPGPVGSYATLRIPASAAVTGDLPLTATLYSPLGHLKMATALITVRATRTSIVGIALTILAVLVLALWWIRTSRRQRAAKHA